MDEDDLQPRKKLTEPPVLDDLSVDELESYLGELEAEMARVRQTLEAKRAYLSGAQGLFKL